MRSFVRIFALTLSSGIFLPNFAQDTTIRSGFAIVTLVSGNVAGLVATESLVDTTTGVAEAIVPPSALITSASLLVAVGPLGENTTAIAVANPSTGSGAVNLVLTDQQGVIVLNTTFNLGPHGHFSKYLNEFFATPLTGSPISALLTVSAEIPVAILALNFREDDFASVPLTSLAFPLPIPTQPVTPTIFPPSTVSILPVPPTVSIGGPGALIFPQVVSGGGWFTEIVIGNTSAGPQNIRIDFFGANGANTGSLTDITIPSRGLFFFSTESASSALF